MLRCRVQVDHLSISDETIDRAGLVGLAVLAVALTIVVATWPALPVDETRYLTVAWEMRAMGSWSLPTLNFEPYSHKPPLLFWLINASWSLFGVAVWPARLVGVAAMATTLLLTHGLDRRLAPGSERGPAASALILLGLPLFVALGFSIMFDMLLSAAVVGAMLALWQAGRGGGPNSFIAYGLCTGIGLLAKGPVFLLFTLPAAVLAWFWIETAQRRGWYLRLGASLALGVAIALAWALRAAYLGGPDFAEMLFWKQSAGRIASSFAHARPFWFYGPILVLFLIPLLFWRPLWAGLRAIRHERNEARNFLLCWIGPPLFGLTLISGKQLHYLLPIMPALALLMSLGLRAAAPRSTDKIPLLVLAGALLVGSIVIASAGGRLLPHNGANMSVISESSVPFLIATGLVALGAIAAYSGSVRRSLIGLAIANLVIVLAAAIQSRATILELFDMQPVANALVPWRDKPIATTARTHGEFGFLARLTRPVEYVPVEGLPVWFARNAGGIAIVRSRAGAIPPELQSYPVINRRRYRMREVITVLAAHPQHSDAAPVRLVSGW